MSALPVLSFPDYFILKNYSKKFSIRVCQIVPQVYDQNRPVEYLDSKVQVMSKGARHNLKLSLDVV